MREQLSKIMVVIVITMVIGVINTGIIDRVLTHPDLPMSQRYLIPVGFSILSILGLSFFLYWVVAALNRDLQEEREKFKAVFTSTSDGIALLDEGRRVLALNSAAENLLGCVSVKQTGKELCFRCYKCQNLNGPSDGQSNCWALQVLRTMEPIPYMEMEITNQEGKKVPVAASCSYIPGSGGKGPNLAVIFRDISERRRLEGEVETLSRIGTDISTLVELDKILASALLGSKELLDCDYAAILETNEFTGGLILRAGAGFTPELGKTFDVPEGLLAKVLSTGQPLLTEGQGSKIFGCSLLPLDMENVPFHLGIPLKIRDKVLGILCIGARSADKLGSRETELAGRLATQIALAMENANLYRQSQNMAILEERQRLAREMHDGLAQSLSFLSLKTRLMEMAVAGKEPDVTQLGEDLTQMNQVVQQMHREVRQCIYDLKMPLDSGGDFVEALDGYLFEFGSQNHLDVELVEKPEEKIPLTLETEVQLMRMVQEALANVRKHAQATRVEVRVRKEENLTVIIKDNGRGFDRAKVAEEKGHFGLGIMDERVKSIGGTVAIYSSPGAGTEVKIEVPLVLKRLP